MKNRDQQTTYYRGPGDAHLQLGLGSLAEFSGSETDAEGLHKGHHKEIGYVCHVEARF